MQAGHLVICGEGRLLGLDRGFTNIMQSDHESLIGRDIMELTAPADREECGEAITELRRSHRPFVLSKRFIRDNGTLVWVTNTVSIVANSSGPELIVATIDPLVRSNELRNPVVLLEAARMLVALRQDRAKMFDESLFSDTAWDAMLAAYIAEAEGAAVDVATLAARLAIPPARVQRWIRILLDQGVVELETSGLDPTRPKCFRLTGAAHVRIEEHLAKAGGLQVAAR